jgi:hypothetical protein
MRGLGASGQSTTTLLPNLSNAEANNNGTVFITPTGFYNDTTGNYTTSGDEIIYIAIRRPMKTPESATEVFAIDTAGSASEPRAISGFPVDMAFRTDPSQTQVRSLSARLTQGQYMKTNATDAEASTTNFEFDYNNGVSSLQLSSYYYWMWKRAPGFFDVVCYTGAGSTQTVKHNLGVAPEMLWFKSRDLTSNWDVYIPKSNGTEFYDLKLNNNTSLYTREYSYEYARMNAAPDESSIYLNTQYFPNATVYDHICYLFASVPGVSKVGIVNVSGQTDVDCGFSSGARFVMYRPLATGNGNEWKVFDTTRGIITGNDPHLYLNTTDAEITSTDFIDPLSSGFSFSGNDPYASGDVLFYAIA